MGGNEGGQGSGLSVGSNRLGFVGGIMVASHVGGWCHQDPCMLGSFQT